MVLARRVVPPMIQGTGHLGQLTQWSSSGAQWSSNGAKRVVKKVQIFMHWQNHAQGVFLCMVLGRRVVPPMIQGTGHLGQLTQWSSSGTPMEQNGVVKKAQIFFHWQNHA